MIEEKTYTLAEIRDAYDRAYHRDGGPVNWPKLQAAFLPRFYIVAFWHEPDRVQIGDRDGHARYITCGEVATANTIVAMLNAAHAKGELGW